MGKKVTNIDFIRRCKENGIELIYFLEPKFKKYETSGNLYFTDIDKLIEYINSKR